MGFVSECFAGPGYAHHILLLPWPRLAGERARLYDPDTNGDPHHPGALHLDQLNHWYHRHDHCPHCIIHGWNHYLHRILITSSLGVCPRQGFSVFLLHRRRKFRPSSPSLHSVLSPSPNALLKVRPGWDIPVNALIVVLGVSLLISALNFGSEVALGAIISLSNAALLFSYISAIGCVRLKRWRREPLLPRRWSLGRWGALVNDVALVFLIVSFVFSFFPMGPMPALIDMNWAIVIFAFVLVAAASYYWLQARKIYVAPVTLVKE